MKIKVEFNLPDNISLNDLKDLEVGINGMLSGLVTRRVNILKEDIKDVPICSMQIISRLMVK